jgi:multiple sugar transport system substrate-binding protein
MKLNRKMFGLMVVGVILLVSTISLAAPVEITIWSRGNPQYLEAYQAIEKMYMKKNPNVVIKHALFADLEDKLLTAYMGGEAPDAWICDTVTTGRWERYNMAAVVNPKTIPNAKYVIPSAWGTCKGADGKLYAIPWSVQAQAMYYRADWLKKLNMKVPTNWNEMINVAEAMTTKDPDGNGKNDTYGIAVYGSTNRGYAYWTFQDWLWQAGGSVLKPNKAKKGKWVANLNTPECKKALQFEKDMA